MELIPSYKVHDSLIGLCIEKILRYRALVEDYTKIDYDDGGYMYFFEDGKSPLIQGKRVYEIYITRGIDSREWHIEEIWAYDSTWNDNPIYAPKEAWRSILSGLIEALDLDIQLKEKKFNIFPAKVYE